MGVSFYGCAEILWCSPLCPCCIPSYPHLHVIGSGCLERLLVAKTPPPPSLPLCQPQPVLLTKEICRLRGLQLREFPWQQPPRRSLLPAKTLISESGCCCFSRRFINRGRGGKNWRRRKKSLLLAEGREGINYRATL